jgi:hypothetical protein
MGLPGYGGWGRRFWFEGVELGKAKAGSVEEVVAKITGGAERKKGRKVKVRMIARIRAEGGMTRTRPHTTRM